MVLVIEVLNVSSLVLCFFLVPLRLSRMLST